MEQTFLFEFGLVLIIATALGLIARLLKQPLILAYLIAGVIIGPFALGLVQNFEIIKNFASIGIVFLLFLIGLELNPRKLLEIGGSALAVAVAQILFSGLIYYLAATIFGLTGVSALFLAAALTFSSTAIIVTLLSNRNDLNSLHGKIIVGVLLVQDFVAIILLTFFSGISSGGSLSIRELSFQISARAIVLFALTYLVGQYLLPITFHRIARSQELLFLSGLAWCFCLSMVALSLGFSAEIGAFLAGITLAPLPYSAHIAAKTKPLRDFFIMIFFIYLGTSLVFTNLTALIKPALIFSLLILLANPFIVMIIMALLGYRKRTSFITGLTLTQTSEFSFIVVVLGAKINLFPKEIVTLTSLVAIFTVFVSTYLISNTNKIYHWLWPYLKFLDSGQIKNDLYNIPEDLENHIILIGCNRIGSIVLETLKKNHEKVAIIDFDPKKIRALTENKENCYFGDAADQDIVEHLHVQKAKMVISTIDKIEENEMVLKIYRKANHRLKIVLMAQTSEDALELYAAGADLVIVPTFISGDYLSLVLKQIYKGEAKLDHLKDKEIEALRGYVNDPFLKKLVAKTGK